MKITVENLIGEFHNISAQMPQNIVDSFPTIEKNIRFYGKSEKINAVIDRFVDTVNANLKTGKSTTKRKSTPKQKAGKPTGESSKYTKITKERANIIIAQLGGEAFVEMTGAKHFKWGGDEFGFTFGQNESESNRVSIKLYKDLYYITFYNGREPLKEYEMVDCDQLRDIFEDYTGMNVTSNPRTDKDESEPDIYFEPFVKDEPVSKPEPEPTSKPEPEKKSTKTKSKKATKEEPMQVIEFPAELELIKRFCNMQGKVKSKTEIYDYIKKLQKAITEKKVRKHNIHAKHIEDIQYFMIGMYNKMQSGTKKIELKEPWYNELKKVSFMKWADHIVVIRKYINIHNSTQKGLKVKAQELLTKIEKSTFSEKGKEYISNIKDSLQDYLSGKTEQVVMTRFALEGLYGIAGLSGLGNIPGTPPDTENKVMSAADFKNASFNLMGFTGKWLQLIGNPAAPFKMMLWGTGGSGKSTLAIEFARYLAGSLNKRVLYVANEEGAGATLHDKMTRLNAFHHNLFITKTLPVQLGNYDFVFCDSVNSMQLELPKFEQTAKMFSRLSWVLVFQTTKDGNFLGEKNWQHAVDVEVYCEDGKARALKSRFGGKEMIDVF